MSSTPSIDTAIQLSLQILQEIDAENWDAITKLDGKRVEIIESVFQQGAKLDNDKVLLLKQKNDEIVGRLLAIQQQTRQKHQTLSQASNAAKAYLDNA